MKVLETHFDGYHFRSRLEARWAVFFKTLKIAYEYEKEGYDLDGVWYLPDFYLPHLDCFIEVKGKDPELLELDKAYRLKRASGKEVYLLFEIDPLLWSPDTFGLVHQLFISRRADIAQRRGNSNRRHISKGSLKSVCEYSKTSESVLQGEFAK